MSAFCLDTVLADSHVIDVFLETALAYSRVFAMHFPELLALRVYRLQLRFTVRHPLCPLTDVSLGLRASMFGFEMKM
jgi:hypothetical protein